MADHRGWLVNTPRDPERRGGRDVLVDYRPKVGVRFSPHFYNADEELKTAIETVDQILSDKTVVSN